MENARNTQKCEASVAVEAAPIFACGELPTRKATVTAEVLARLLNHERLTGLEAVFNASTTRLAAVVEYLQKRYGWVISREDKVTGCADGRVATVSEYFLMPEVIATAAIQGAPAWCVAVRAARCALRAKAAEAKRAAARANASRGRLPACAGQFNLFEGAAQ